MPNAGYLVMTFEIFRGEILTRYKINTYKTCRAKSYIQAPKKLRLIFVSKNHFTFFSATEKLIITKQQLLVHQYLVRSFPAITGVQFYGIGLDCPLEINEADDPFPIKSIHSIDYDSLSHYCTEIYTTLPLSNFRGKKMSEGFFENKLNVESRYMRE